MFSFLKELDRELSQAALEWEQGKQELLAQLEASQSAKIAALRVSAETVLDLYRGYIEVPDPRLLQSYTQTLADNDLFHLGTARMVYPGSAHAVGLHIFRMDERTTSDQPISYYGYVGIHEQRQPYHLPFWENLNSGAVKKISPRHADRALVAQFITDIQRIQD